MDSNYEEMLYDSDGSESEYEVIVVNPNINYESDGDSGMEDLSHNGSSPSKQQQTPTTTEIEINQEIEVKEEESIIKTEEISCDSIGPNVDDENSMSSNNSMRKVRRKLNLAEYKMRRANEKPLQQPLFDVPRKVAAFELCDTPATLPLLILPTDPSWIKHNQKGLKQEADNLSTSTTAAAFNPSHFEEITMLSMGCNTDITIAPMDELKDSSDKILNNIVENLKKGNKELLLNSSTSLFSSIQAVVQGKCASTETEIIEGPKELGEDKVIMYLRKDRLRPFKCSFGGTQTDSISLFPPLLLTPSIVLSRSRSRSYRRKMSKSKSRSRSRSYSPSRDYDRVRYNSKYSRSQHSIHSSSMNSSESSASESDSDSMSYNSSSDSLNRFNVRQNFRFYNRNQNQSYNLQERRIIYIGGLEEETTKDEIRRKFLNYGTIKKISLHSKENGLRYGFVTFEDASCAYEVIDTFAKDQRINKYDIRFGGRRHFCKQTYADLDSMPDSEYVEPPKKPAKDLSFEDLLKLAKKEILCKK